MKNDEENVSRKEDCSLAKVRINLYFKGADAKA